MLFNGCKKNHDVEKITIMKPKIELPKNAAKILKSTDSKAVFDILDSMRVHGMKEELLTALKRNKKDNYFRLKIMECLTEQDFKKDLRLLLNMLEEENYVHPGGSANMVHTKLKEKLVEIISKNSISQFEIKNIDDYDEIESFINEIRKEIN
jgi:hypothetical protein